MQQRTEATAATAAPASPAAAGVPLGPNEAEVDRIMAICNACRYCEGFCAVFPAMERRLSFAHGDVHLLANLCHNCGACLHACQYAPPNAFDVNVPRSLAAVRATTYEQYAWPGAFGSLYRHQGVWVALALAAGLALFFFLATRFGASGGVAVSPADFYAVIPHGVMATAFSVVMAWVVVAFAIGVRRFWRGLPTKPDPVSLSAATAEAIASALTLRHLDGGGDGCNDQDDTPTHRRRRFHHVTFYGFALCFAATVVATFLHYVLGQQAPYPLASLPVILGTAGGIGLLIGPVGLWRLNLRRHPLHGDPRQRPMDVAFLALLFATSLSGLLLLALRSTGAMPALLAVHLGVVMALFVTLPYGKFAHAVYRVTALVKDAIEKRQPNSFALKLD